MHLNFFKNKLLLALFLVFALFIAGTSSKIEISKWDRYILTPDSMEYQQKFTMTSLTSPVYHYFINFLVFNSDGVKKVNPGFYSLKDEPLLKRLKNSLYRVVFVQKILFVISLICLFTAMSLHIHPILSWFAILVLYKAGLFTVYANYILTETLTQAFLLFIVSLFFIFLKNKNAALLVLSGFLCATAFLTRPASAYNAVFLFAMIAVGIPVNWRKYIVYGLVGCLFIGSAYFFETYRVPSGNKKVNINSKFMGNINKYMYAILLASKEDIELMEDEQSKEFFSESIKLRDRYKVTNFDKMIFHSKVLIPATNKIKVWRYSAEAEKLYKKVHDPIINKYPGKYMALKWDYFLKATSEMSSKKYLPFWWLVLFIVATNLYLRGAVLVPSLVILLVHIASCVIMTVFSRPQSRYVDATYFLVVLALILTMIELIKKMKSKFKTQILKEDTIV